MIDNLRTTMFIAKGNNGVLINDRSISSASGRRGTMVKPLHNYDRNFYVLNGLSCSELEKPEKLQIILYLRAGGKFQTRRLNWSLKTTMNTCACYVLETQVFT